MLLITLTALIIAVIAYSYKEIIGREKILNWWFTFGTRFEDRFFYRPIWGCEKCFAGQVAFWIYFFNWLSINFDTKAPFWRLIFLIIPKYNFGVYNVFFGVFSVSLSVFLTFLLSKTIKKLNYE